MPHLRTSPVPGIDLPGGMKALYSLANVPKSWPLARLTIPLSAASKHLERLLEGCCMEIVVRNTNPDLQLHFVRRLVRSPPLITFGFLICNLFRFACFVNSSLRFLIPNLHPICTCSCLFTPLTEGRSARDLTQAATSQKKETWWSCLLSIWLRQFLRCFGMYWSILARSSMILRLNPCSYLSSGSTPSTERCLTQLPGIDLASLWS